MDGAAEVTEMANPQSAPISAALPQSSPQLSDARWGLVRYASSPLTHGRKHTITRGRESPHTITLQPPGMRLHWFFVAQLQHELLYRRLGAGCHSIVSLNSLCRGHDEEPACLTQTTTVVPALCTARPRSPSHPARAESLGERISRHSSRAHGGRRSWRAPSTGALRLCGLQLSAEPPT